MKLKLDENKQVVLSPEGHPVYIRDTGEELNVDVVRLMDGSAKFREEAKTKRLEAESLALQLEEFQKASKKSDKPSEDVESLRKQLAEERKLREQEKTALTMEMNKQQIYNHFSRSNLFSGENSKTVLRADPAYKLFGDRFVVKNGQVVALDKKGGDLYSNKDVTSLASFDEAVDIIINEMGMKNDIFRASSGSVVVKNKATPSPLQANQMNGPNGLPTANLIIASEISRCSIKH